MADSEGSLKRSPGGPLTFLKKLGYAVGSPASNLSYQVVSMFLLYFYTDLFGISAAVVAIVFLVARIIDAVADPLIGYLADQTRTRWGTYRPYLLFGAPILCVFYVLTFVAPDLSTSGKIVYAFTTYIIYGVLYSLVNIPYNTLASAISQDPDERNSLSGIGLILTTFAVMIVSFATKPVARFFPSERTGFTFVIAAYAVISLALFLVAFVNTKERAHGVPQRRYGMREAVILVGKNKYLLMLAGIYLLTGITSTMRSASAIYYFKYGIGNDSLFGPYMVVQMVGSIIGCAITPALARRAGNKRNIFLAALLLVICGDIGVVIWAYTLPVLFFVLSFLIGIGGGVTIVLSWSMLPDTVEYGEWKTGTRGAGITYSFFSLMAKLSAAVGGALGAAILAWVGYVPNQAQGPAVIQTMLYMFALGPALTGAVAFVVMIFYRIDNAFFARILGELSARKARGDGEQSSQPMR